MLAMQHILLTADHPPVDTFNPQKAEYHENRN